MFLRSARWITDKFILVMLGLFPLFVGFRLHAYTAVTAAKYHFFVYATCAWFAAVVVLLVVGLLRGERYHIDPRPAHLAMALFLLFGALSAAVSEYGKICLIGADRYDGYVTMLLYGVIFFGVSFLAAPRRRYAWALGFSCAVCCVIAVLQLGGLDPFWLYPEGLNYYDKYEAMNAPFLGTIGNTGVLASFLCLAAPLLIVFAVLSDEEADTLLLLPGALALGVLALCDIDAGIVALAGCVLVTVPMALRKRKAARIAAGVSGGATLAGLGVLYFWPGTSGTLWEMSQVLHGHLSDEFGSRRGQIWKQCWQLFLEKPWLGGGPGTNSQRIDIRWSRYIEALGRERVVTVGNAHNVYLSYLVSIGLFGALSYVAAAVCSLVTWFRRRTDGALYPALGSAFLCFMLQDFFSIGLCLTTPMLFVVWALLESPERLSVTEDPDPDTE